MIGVALAWLVTRTDLPGRRLWGVAAALPLVIPSYVAALALLGALGPRGLAQQALGVEELPDIRGYWGALLALTLTTYPYVYLLCASALRNQDPALEDAARGLGYSPWRTFFTVTLADAAADGGRRRRARRALRALRLRRRLAHELRRADEGDLPQLPGALRPDACRRARAPARRADGGRAADRGVDAAPRALLPLRAGRRARAQDRAARALALAVARLLRAQRRVLPRAAGRRARLLAGAGHRERARPRVPLGRDRRLADRLRARRRRRGTRGLAHRRARHALPLAEDAAARAARLLRQRAARHRHRALARVLHGALRIARLPDARACSSSRTSSASSRRRCRERPRRWRP